MTKQQLPTAQAHSTSTGHALSTGDWLDAHFEMCRPEYESMVRSVGIQPGWRVLDAGCGGGSFLPLLTELVGPSGAITALDLAPENIAAVEARLPTWNFPCPVETQVGSVLALPFPDHAFDAVWFANTSQYLTDPDLRTALAELRRVVRPGGLVAVKESDAGLMRCYSREPYLLPHLWERILAAKRATNTNRAAGGLRSWLVRAGLTDVWLRSTLTERFAPYSTTEKQFHVTGFQFFVRMAKSFDLPEVEQDEWAEIAALGEQVFDHPDHYFREGFILTVGQVPGEK